MCRSKTRRGLRCLAAILWASPVGAAAGAPYAEPWDPAAVAAGEAAVARLGGKRALEIRGNVRSILGLGTGVAGASRAILASVSEVRQAMRDLAATETALEVRIELPADVLFDFDKAEIKTEGQPALEKLITVLRAHSGAEVTIGGHTDAKGGEVYNQRLSERRAAAVRDWLAKKGALDGARVNVRGFGATKPVAPNQRPDGSDDPEGRQKNRRVEIVVRKAGR